MKNVLVATDYSDAADNAINYAVELAKFIGAKLVLLHVYSIPIPTGEVPIAMIPPQELQELNSKRMKILEDRIQKKIGNTIRVESFVRSGLPVDEILGVIKEKTIDLVIMGIAGAGKLTEILVGSTTTSLMKKTKTPVLVIPEYAKYQKVEKIIYACDYEKIEDHSVLKPMCEFAQIFGAELQIFNVNDSRIHPKTNEAIEGIALEQWIGNLKHSYWFSDKSNVIDAINGFAKKYEAAMIAMVARKHYFIENIIHERETKKMAFHANIPILSLHD